ncbi:MAG TPA: hypothetical protein VIL86_16085 [Tepidisphaeraceae bacterium]|jgi:hypothetical protein
MDLPLGSIEMLADPFRQEDIECRIELTLFFGRLPPMGDSDGERCS